MTRHANFILERSTTGGTGDLTVTGVTAWRRISDEYDVGSEEEVFTYGIRDTVTLAVETGLGHISDANTLVRDRVIRSSNGDALVNFAGGNIKEVIVDIDADSLDLFDSAAAVAAFESFL